MEIEITYKEKLFLLEQFKTLNSRVINSIHYLYDLRKTIEEKHVQDKHKQELLDHIFFTIGKILMDLPYDKKRLKLDMEHLKNYQHEHQVFNYFYQHSRQFLSDIEQIKKILHDNKEIKLFNAIDHVVVHLQKYYKNNRNEHKLITFSFFVFAFLILVILVFNYRRVQQTTRELQAFRYAIENSDNAIVITNKEREIQYVNEAFEMHSGYKKEEVLGENPRILKSDLLNEDFYKNMNEHLRDDHLRINGWVLLKCP